MDSLVKKRQKQTMNMRERILSVYRGGKPDKVPLMLDLSHWFYHCNRMP